MSSRESIVYALPAKMGGVVTNLANLQAACDRSRYLQHTILTRNAFDVDTPFDGRMGSDAQVDFRHQLPVENLYSVLRRFGRAVPRGGGVLVASDWLELAWASVYPSERAVIQILHADFDYYYDLASRHDDCVDVFVGCSKLVSETLSSALPHRAGDVHYIPYGVPIPPSRREARVGPLRLLYAGRFERVQKRIFDLPRIDDALRRIGAPVRWTIAGGGPDEEELRSRWETGERVQWLGVLSNQETRDLMMQHDVLVLPSAAEGLPLALLEAMSAGVVPVVTDLQSGIREVVIPDSTGFRIPLGHVEGFVAAIARLAADRGILETMSEAARQLVSQGFSVERQAASYQALYDRWREIRRDHERRGKLAYGSRLDKPWIPNVVTRWMRSRRRAELTAALSRRRQRGLA